MCDKEYIIRTPEGFSYIRRLEKRTGLKFEKLEGISAIEYIKSIERLAKEIIPKRKKEEYIRR